MDSDEICVQDTTADLQKQHISACVGPTESKTRDPGSNFEEIFIKQEVPDHVNPEAIKWKGIPTEPLDVSNVTDRQQENGRSSSGAMHFYNGEHVAGENIYESANSSMGVHTLLIEEVTHPYKCGSCLQRFASKTLLTIHRRSHSGEKPYPCTICGKKFKTKYYIPQHMMSHTEQRSFALGTCNICGKSFKTKGYLPKHMILHSREKPSVCDNVTSNTPQYDSRLSSMLFGGRHFLNCN